MITMTFFIISMMIASFFSDIRRARAVEIFRQELKEHMDEIKKEKEEKGIPIQ